MVAPAKKPTPSQPHGSHLPMMGIRYWEWIVTSVLFLVLTYVGAQFYSQAIGYKYSSPEHFQDLVRARLWTLGSLSLAIAVFYAIRKTKLAPLWAVFSVSAYFLILYGILFRASQYGMNSQWGDNGNRLAEVCKMMAYGSFFQDWYLKDLPSFYPPGWFAITALYAKLIGIEAYQTVKWGYYLIFLLYPWLLYFSWRRLVSARISAAVVVVTLFFAYKYMDSLFYESVIAGLFIPWWLYYVERGWSETTHLLSRRDYIFGSVVGGILFMTYYYWFFVGFVSTPFILIARYLQTRSFRFVWRDICHRAIIAGGVTLVSAIYWLPLLRVINRYGAESAQHAWFFERHMNLTNQWPQPSIETFLIFAGVFSAFYFWEKYGRGSIPFLFLGSFFVLLLDRLYNLRMQTIQSRKVLEYVHLFALTPLGIAAIEFWDGWKHSRALRTGAVGVLLLVTVVVANEQLDLSETAYRNGVNQRVPLNDLRPFEAVNTSHTVFLTDQYLQSIYLPYYLFIPLNNMTSHTAGRYSQRELFLKMAATITEPDLLAYVLRYNRFSPIDYVYLPIDSVTGQMYIALYQAGYDHPPEPVTYTFVCKIWNYPESFVKRQEQGVYEIIASARSQATDDIVDSKYHDIFWCLEPLHRY